MHPFRYERAADVPAAVMLMTQAPQGAFLGGGTNLVDLMRLGVATPDLLVDVRRLTSDRIEERDGGGLRIGAAVPNSDLAADCVVRDRYPVLAEAVLAGASGQLRNLATTGGNLLQRTRCVYFQNVTTGCVERDPGSGCSAIEGYHRELAIFGTSPSRIATHPSDLAVALAALDAEVHIEGPAGHRVIALTDLHRLPGDEPQTDTVLGHGDLITAVEIPPSSSPPSRATARCVTGPSCAFALVSVAAALDVDDGVVRDVRIALGGVAPKPWQGQPGRASVAGRAGDPGSFAARPKAELSAARPLSSNGAQGSVGPQYHHQHVAGVGGRRSVTVTIRAIGAAINRFDGPDKVRGLATYAWEHLVDHPAYLHAVQSTIAAGRITGVHTEAALAVPGVLHVLSFHNAPRLAWTADRGDGGAPVRHGRVPRPDWSVGSSRRPRRSPATRPAWSSSSTRGNPMMSTCASIGTTSMPQPTVNAGFPTDTATGRCGRCAGRRAAVRIDATYTHRDVPQQSDGDAREHRDLGRRRHHRLPFLAGCAHDAVPPWRGRSISTGTGSG